MLAAMSLPEFQELLVFYRVEQDNKKKSDRKVSEIKMQAFMEAKIRAQQKRAAK